MTKKIHKQSNYLNTLIIGSYTLLCLFLFLALHLQPSHEKYIYAKFNKNLTFSNITALLKEKNIRIIAEGTFENSYILYSDEQSLKDNLKSHTVFLINPIFAQGCNADGKFI